MYQGLAEIISNSINVKAETIQHGENYIFGTVK